MTIAPPAADAPPGPPPRPRLTLRVGVTGHRPDERRFPASSFAFARRRLEATFAAIDSALGRIAGQPGNPYVGPHEARLVCGLAEGADQLAAAAMPAAWALDAVLPFPQASYQADFRQSAADGRDVTQDFEKALERATTKVELPDDPRVKRARSSPQTDAQNRDYRRRRDAGYARLGGFLLRQADVLVAVWDGEREEGPGGTADVARAAIDAGIPVVWISSLEDTIVRMVEDIDDDGRPLAPEADCLKGALAVAIAALVLPRTQAEAGALAPAEDAGPDAGERLTAFLDEKWPKASRWITYDWFRRWMEGKKRRGKIPPETFDGYRRRWAPLSADVQGADDLKARIEKVLLPRYAWADALAVDYSHRYRSAYFNCYLMAAAAVFVALCALAHEWFGRLEGQLAFKFALVLAELVIIGVIVLVVWRGQRQRWQEKWVEYRALAEMLWDVRFLAYLGEHGRAQRVGELEPASSAWFLWYLRATIREVGLPTAVLDGAYQQSLLDAVDRHVVCDQIVWHRGNARALRRMNQFLYRAGTLCFFATALVLALYFVGWAAFALGMALQGHSFGEIVGAPGAPDLLPEWNICAKPALHRLGAWLSLSKNLVTFAAAFLPALGAALSGIRETGDFGRFSERSTKTAVALEELRRNIAQAKSRLSLDGTGDVLLSTAQVLTEDLVAWHSVYGHKRLDLPA